MKETRTPLLTEDKSNQETQKPVSSVVMDVRKSYLLSGFAAALEAKELSVDLKDTSINLYNYLSAHEASQPVECTRLAQKAEAVVSACLVYEKNQTLDNFSHLSDSIAALEKEVSYFKAKCKAICAGVISASCTAAAMTGITYLIAFAPSHTMEHRTRNWLAVGVGLVGIITSYKTGKAVYKGTLSNYWGNREISIASVCEQARLLKPPMQPVTEPSLPNGIELKSLKM
ncbi:MAG: hypothetical protein ABI597_03370 [Gammaproteobacteria bacterium]